MTYYDHVSTLPALSSCGGETLGPGNRWGVPDPRLLLGCGWFGRFTMIQCQFGQWRPSKLSHSWTKRKKFCESKIMKRSWSDFQWFISSALSILAKIGLLGQVNITWHNAWTWIGTMTWSWLVPSSLGTCRFGPQKSHWLVDGKGGPTFFSSLISHYSLINGIY